MIQFISLYWCLILKDEMWNKIYPINDQYRGTVKFSEEINNKTSWRNLMLVLYCKHHSLWRTSILCKKSLSCCLRFYSIAIELISTIRHQITLSTSKDLFTYKEIFKRYDFQQFQLLHYLPLYIYTQLQCTIVCIYMVIHSPLDKLSYLPVFICT